MYPQTPRMIGARSRIFDVIAPRSPAYARKRMEIGWTANCPGVRLRWQLLRFTRVGCLRISMLALASFWVLDAARVVGSLGLAWGALANSYELAWHPKNYHLDFPQ